MIGEPFISSHMPMCTQVEPTADARVVGGAPEADAEADVGADSLDDKRFTVTDLRRPVTPLPLDKVLCEQNVATKVGLFDAYCKENNAPQTANTTVMSKGGARAAHEVQNSLHKFMRKTNEIC